MLAVEEVEFTDIKKAEIKSDNSEEDVPVRRVPLICKILYILAALCAPLYFLFVTYPSFSDFFNKYISPVPRAILATITQIIPFSISEFLLILSPVILGILVFLGMKYYSDSWKNIGVFCVIMISVAAYIFTTFTIAFVPAYRGTRLDKKMGLDKQDVTAEELMDTAIILRDRMEEEIDNITFDATGASVMPYGYSELNDKMMKAYDKACEKYDFIQKLDSRFKRIILSEPMTYTHISGVYTFFTGETNLNTNFPDYCVVYTSAHEFAHQRGIAREDEAEFVAFLVCMESDDSYIRYCGYANLLDSVLSALSKANSEYFSAVFNSVHPKYRGEIYAFSAFYEKYRENVANDVTGAVNNTFLQVNGTEGTKSYGMVVDLAVAYYKAEK